MTGQLRTVAVAKPITERDLEQAKGDILRDLNARLVDQLMPGARQELLGALKGEIDAACDLHRQLGSKAGHDRGMLLGFVAGAVAGVALLTAAGTAWIATGASLTRQDTALERMERETESLRPLVEEAR